MTFRSIYCCGCESKVGARLTSGEEIYPHRQDLHTIPFWKCDTCGNYVGCHYKSRTPTEPLGSIPTKEIRDARNYLHKAIDPMWKSGAWDRKQLYRALSDKLGKEYHTGNIRTIEEAKQVYEIIQGLKQ